VHGCPLSPHSPSAGPYPTRVRGEHPEAAAAFDHSRKVFKVSVANKKLPAGEVKKDLPARSKADRTITAQAKHIAELEHTIAEMEHTIEYQAGHRRRLELRIARSRHKRPAKTHKSTHRRSNPSRTSTQGFTDYGDGSSNDSGDDDEDAEYVLSPHSPLSPTLSHSLHTLSHSLLSPTLPHSFIIAGSYHRRRQTPLARRMTTLSTFSLHSLPLSPHSLHTLSHSLLSPTLPHSFIIVARRMTTLLHQTTKRSSLMPMSSMSLMP